MEGCFAQRLSLDGFELRLACMQDGPRARADLMERLFAGFPAPWPVPELARGPLGQPVCLNPAGMGASARRFGVSFSRYGGVLWAAAAETPMLGVDAEGADSFADPYADSHAFAASELACALALCATRAEARALLWCLKEASAKALGTGFNTLDPCDLSVVELRPDERSNAIAGLACRVASPLGELSALAVLLDGIRLAVAVRRADEKESA